MVARMSSGMIQRVQVEAERRQRKPNELKGPKRPNTLRASLLRGRMIDFSSIPLPPAVPLVRVPVEAERPPRERKGRKRRKVQKRRKVRRVQKGQNGRNGPASQNRRRTIVPIAVPTPVSTVLPPVPMRHLVPLLRDCQHGALLQTLYLP